MFVSIPVFHRHYTSRSLFALADFGSFFDCLPKTTYQHHTLPPLYEWGLTNLYLFVFSAAGEFLCQQSRAEQYPWVFLHIQQSLKSCHISDPPIIAFPPLNSPALFLFMPDACSYCRTEKGSYPFWAIQVPCIHMHRQDNCSSGNPPDVRQCLPSRGITVNRAGQKEYRGVIFNNDAFESPLKQVPWPYMAYIKAPGIGQSQPLHAFWEIWTVRF